jgi:hypothetical protein
MFGSNLCNKMYHTKQCIVKDCAILKCLLIQQHFKIYNFFKIFVFVPFSKEQVLCLRLRILKLHYLLCSSTPFNKPALVVSSQSKKLKNLKATLFALFINTLQQAIFACFFSKQEIERLWKKYKIFTQNKGDCSMKLPDKRSF